MLKNNKKRSKFSILLFIMVVFLFTACSKNNKNEEDYKKSDELITEAITETVTETPILTEAITPTNEPSEEVTETPTLTPTPTDMPTVTSEPELTENPKDEQGTDNVENITPKGDKLTEDEAIQKVGTFSKEALGLSKGLDQYSVVVDSWTTIVDGNECYCLNVYDIVDNKQQLTAIYYISVDGSKLYTRDDEAGVFVEIKK